jgi:hypothetical protein
MGGEVTRNGDGHIEAINRSWRLYSNFATCLRRKLQVGHHYKT